MIGLLVIIKSFLGGGQEAFESVLLFAYTIESTGACAMYAT